MERGKGGERMSSTVQAGSLAGRTIGVTAERRAGELAGALERKGARVWHAPTMHTVPLSDDPELRAATERALAGPVHGVVITTGMGMTGWLEAAHGWGLGDRLVRCFADARVYVRGPKAKGAVRGAGLTEHWSAPSESNAEVLERLRAEGVHGQRIVLQQHGAPLPEFAAALREAGAEVVPVSPYRWEGPAELAPVHRLLDGVLGGEVDALAFTSAPAAAGLLRIAEESGRHGELLHALRTGVLAACVGPVTAAPLVEADVPVVQPDRGRLGALVRTIETELGPAVSG